MRLAEDVAELGVVEQRPIQDGRNMTMMLGAARKPVRSKAGSRSEPSPTADAAGRRPEAAAEAPSGRARRRGRGQADRRRGRGSR